MSSETFDVIVAGAGAVGGAAMWQAARRGLKVLGIDRFPPGHDRGSSHGRTRIIRQAYFEHSDYVPLLLRAYQLWSELESAQGESLLHQAGLLQIGPADGVVVQGVLASARRHGLQVESLSTDECRRRFPAFATPDGHQGVFEAQAGYLLVERCVIAQAAAAVRHGAILRVGEVVRDWRREANHFVVRTEKQEYAAARLIVTAGAWAGKLLADLAIPLVVRRKPVFWFASPDDSYDIDHGCPTYLFETPRGVFYGFPRIDESGVKVAEHTGGETVEDPLSVDRAERGEDRRRLQQFIAEHLPRLESRVLDHSVCMYTMSPDEHFIVDRHPACPSIVFAAGLSGHGFKFAPVLGQILVELAIDGQSALPAEFLSLRRESLQRFNAL